MTVVDGKYVNVGVITAVLSENKAEALRIGVFPIHDVRLPQGYHFVTVVNHTKLFVAREEGVEIKLDVGNVVEKFTVEILVVLLVEFDFSAAKLETEGSVTDK